VPAVSASVRLTKADISVPRAVALASADWVVFASGVAAAGSVAPVPTIAAPPAPTRSRHHATATTERIHSYVREAGT
jgi:hypothetical protein